jgi:hypothetical protein
MSSTTSSAALTESATSGCSSGDSSTAPGGVRAVVPDQVLPP